MTAPIMPLVSSLRRPRPASKVAFSPSSISGLIGAWDFSDTAKITASGGAVSQVDGAYGTSAALTQSTGSYQPTTGTRTQNSLNVLDFDGSGDYLISTVTASSRAETVFVVCYCDATPPSEKAMLGTDKYGSRMYQHRPAASYKMIYGKSDVSIDATCDVSAFNATTPYLIMGASSTLNVIWALNGSAEETDSTSVTFDSGAVTLVGGAYNGGGIAQKWDGWFGEILIYDSQLGSADRDTVRAYLNTKWAIY